MGCTSLSDSSDLADVSTADLQLALDVYNRLRNNHVTGEVSLGVTAQDGVITLYGSLQDPSARALATAIARSTPGVKGVVNRLTR